MQVTETLSDGLKREFRVVVPANELDSKVNTRLDELKGRSASTASAPAKSRSATSSACTASP